MLVNKGDSIQQVTRVRITSCRSPHLKYSNSAIFVFATADVAPHNQERANPASIIHPLTEIGHAHPYLGWARTALAQSLRLRTPHRSPEYAFVFLTAQEDMAPHVHHGGFQHGKPCEHKIDG